MAALNNLPPFAVSLLACVSFTVGITAEAQESQVSEKDITFDVLEYRVLGNTVLPALEIERALYSLTGRQKTMQDVESARQTLEKTYHDAGYGTVFVDIPEQSADDGVIRLQVSEGRIDRVKVTGTRYFSNREIRAAVPSLVHGTVPRLPEVQAELTSLNRETVDRSVTPILKAGRTPGTVDVELKVNDNLPLHGALDVNDRYTAGTSRLRLNASLSYDRLFGEPQSISFQYQTAPQDRSDVEAYIASYVYRDLDSRSTWALYGVNSNTDVATLGTLGVIGEGKIYGLRYIKSLPDQEYYQHSVQIGMDYKEFLEDIRISEAQGLRTPIRYMQWLLAYDSAIRTERHTDKFTIAANFGIRQLVNEAKQFQEKRDQGLPNYFYIRGSMEHIQSFPWYLQASLRISGQWSEDALLSNEQFAIGGADTVRGYYESSLLGDTGANATFELRNSSLAKWLKRQNESLYIFGFYDVGVIELNYALPGQSPRSDIASAGIGFRAQGVFGLDAALDWARALKNVGTIKSGDDRIHFLLRYSF